MVIGTGVYANWDDAGTIMCPAPFGLILTPDENVIYVTYGVVDKTSPCGGYEGDSAIYYRQLAE
jgi:DNA-binding beta-propeller fold protein YncE